MEQTHIDFIKNKIRLGIDTANSDEIENAMSLLCKVEDVTLFINELNELLITPNHHNHQFIAKLLQDWAPSPSTIPYVRKALESNFDYLEYTCSESNTIAKWFSWLLYSIGTSEAIDLMKEYSSSDDEGISEEMSYRLSKLNK